ncbi:MAG: serine/threonine-protein kinase [Planctomycetota bacterium]|nr:serine/threonine-protein kinase [Planctomycetota bacterium]
MGGEPTRAATTQSRITGSPDALRAIDDLERTALAAFESDAWMDRASRSEAPVIVGEVAGYRLVRVVARGAQGTVYEAVEPRTGRRVAIKRLIRNEDVLDAAKTVTSAADAATTCAIPIEDTRFARETSVLAALAHPNIVSLLSAPESDGARLLVMEWIEGESFDRWADEVWTAREPADALRVVVRALADTARAVAVAHAIGIVHRDLKPTNVLVGAGDTPKVLDFGLAKEIGTVDATRTQGFAGTPSWCSPEQIDGRAEGIDARTDVHALGLLAYRALTGRATFDPMLPIGTLFEAIRYAVPAFTADDRRRVPTELALVVLRAMEKDPARRYANASALADDLERFLAGEPVEAHPPGAIYVARTLVRRHRTAAMALAVALVAIVAGAALAIVFAIEATRARDAESARADEAVAARVSAERMNDYFRDLLASLRERDATGTPTTAAEIVRLAVQSLETRPMRPELERDLRETLAQVLYEIGDYAESSRQYERLLALADPSTKPIERARVLLELAGARQLADAAEDAYARAKEALAALDGLPPDATTPSRRSDAERELSALVLRARAHGCISIAAMSLRRGTETLAEADEALRLAEASGSARQVASALSTRALALEFTGDIGRAAESGRRAVETARGLGLPEREWTRLLHNAGHLLSHAGKPAEALLFLDEAFAIRVHELGERHPRSLHTAIQRGFALRNASRADEAVAALERVIELASPRANETGDALALHRQNALRLIGAAYLQRGSEGDRARALQANEVAVETWFSANLNSVDRLGSAVRSLTDSLIADMDAPSAAARLRAVADRASEISGRPEAAALVRAIAARRLMEDRHPRDAWMSFTDVATCRADRTLLIESYGAQSDAAFEGELTLLRALERSDDPALLAEGAALRASLMERTDAGFGAASGRSRQIERMRPKAP